MLCPCDSNKTYLTCCAPLHNGEQFASSAKQLMISRFSAYCMAKYKYVYQTYGSEQRKDLSASLLAESDEGCRWIRLKVLETSQQASTGTVEFIAIYAIDNKLYQLELERRRLEVTRLKAEINNLRRLQFEGDNDKEE